MASSKLVVLEERLFSAGDCPVCGELGAVLFLRRLDVDDAYFYYCPVCGVGWTTPPRGMALDSINSLTDIAPNGVAIPSLFEARRFLGDLIEVPFEYWAEFLRYRLSS
jgi:hypothetical protein